MHHHLCAAGASCGLQQVSDGKLSDHVIDCEYELQLSGGHQQVLAGHVVWQSLSSITSTSFGNLALTYGWSEWCCQP